MYANLTESSRESKVLCEEMYSSEIFNSLGEMPDSLRESNTFNLDSYEFQWKELLELNQFEKSLDLSQGSDSCACYVYFPWRNTVQKILKEEYFVFLRTHRNRYKLTLSEQQQLAKKNVLIVGQSVGKSVAVALALERIAGKLVIADFDSLQLSNMNRVQASVLDLGKSKVQIAYEQIKEQDPFLNVVRISEGITANNLPQILKDEKIDLIVEECDDLEIKKQTRLFAKKMQIPLVMETSDKCMVDVERFDRIPNLPIFLGRVEMAENMEFTSMHILEKINFMKRYLDYDLMSHEMKISYSEFGKTIGAWPQLGSEVIMGGAIVAFVVKRILLGDLSINGRYYVDLHSIFG